MASLRFYYVEECEQSGEIWLGDIDSNDMAWKSICEIEHSVE